MAEAVAACGLDRGVDPVLANQRLEVVLAEARAGDRVAARLVLQRVFPGLVQRAAVRARRARTPFGPVLEDLVACAWLAIAEYPSRARAGNAAVKIARDAEYRAYGYVPATVRNTVLMSPDRLPNRPAPGSSADAGPGAGLGGGGGRRWGEPEQVLGELPRMLLDEVAAGYPAADARLLVQLFVFGLTVTEIAAAEKVSPRWIRARRAAALARLADRMWPTSGSSPSSGRAGRVGQVGGGASTTPGDGE